MGTNHKKPDVTKQQEKKIEEEIRRKIEEDLRKQLERGQFKRKKKSDETTGDGGAEINDTQDGGAEE